jgi:hypothetical protein
LGKCVFAKATFSKIVFQRFLINYSFLGVLVVREDLPVSVVLKLLWSGAEHEMRQRHSLIGKLTVHRHLIRGKAFLISLMALPLFIIPDIIPSFTPIPLNIREE